MARLRLSRLDLQFMHFKHCYYSTPEVTVDDEYITVTKGQMQRPRKRGPQFCNEMKN